MKRLSSAVPLKQVEAKLGKIIGEDLPILKKIKKYTIEGGGKRIRPLTHFYTLRMLGSEHKEWVDVGAIGELIHNASLLHDDVVDKSDLRRGKPSAPVLFGNKTVVLAGDYLLACGLNHLSTLEQSKELLVIFSRTIRLLSSGELLQMEWEGNLKTTTKTYEQIIYCKTGCLFGAMTESAALLARKSSKEIAAYRQFGERLGRYFQIRDDYIDYFADAKDSGKTEMQDYERGLITWPVLKLFEAGGSKARGAITRIWKDRTANLPDMLRLMDELQLKSRLSRALETELNHLLAFAEKHPPSAYRDTLASTLAALRV
ncbi:MAG: polyprenyl synthetase family protein [Leptospirales bacterium]|nr:polyprenyl synthetase family protein [Leptospirales bacterium]